MPSMQPNMNNHSMMSAANYGEDMFQAQRQKQMMANSMPAMIPVSPNGIFASGFSGQLNPLMHQYSLY